MLKFPDTVQGVNVAARPSASAVDCPYCIKVFAVMVHECSPHFGSRILERGCVVAKVPGIDP